jgi:hypothetical protein
MTDQEKNDLCQKALLEDKMLQGLFVWQAKRVQQIAPKYLLTKDGIKQLPNDDFILNEIISLINQRSSEIIKHYDL